ncbi:TonB-dependent receptor [Sunxiuqinia sp. A32]|uniref:TonB-dependent receptor n=1 Tax=Sunxiuqinia sp. A32 TaxID=3461496 RepID=UPI004045CEEA
MKLLFILLLISSSVGLQAQSVSVKAEQKPLNEVLIDLRDHYNLQFSFDDSRLSTYKITADKKFSTPEKALDFLLTDLPLAYESSRGIFVIYPIFVKPKEKPVFRLAGQFIDASTGEALPYTHALANDFGSISDQMGNFQFTSEDSLYHLRASHLGYYLLDTLLTAGINHIVKLKSFNVKLKEVRVEGKQVVRNILVGETAGGFQLNHKVANYLPGNGDNSVFNLLRLQPGILAAGEQSNDLIIWGSYEGQSQVLFDGFTLFGMKNFNDNISAVNPFMAKDIQVFKGGYGAEYGERVGGLVNITGVDGDKESPHVNLTLNNMTLNGMFSLPIQKKASVVVAFRQTYYELYDKNVLSVARGRNANTGNLVDRYIYPDYNFRDFNLKFSGNTKNGDSYRISWMGATDRFSYSIVNETRQTRIVNEQEEHNYQTGGSFYYGKGWSDGSQTHFTFSASGIETQVSILRDGWQVQRPGGNGQGGGGINWESTDSDSKNQVGELALKIDHQLALTDRNQLKFGANYFYDRIQSGEDSFQVNVFNQELTDTRVSGFIQDRWSILPEIQLIAGLRGNYLVGLSKTSIQPRLSAKIRFTDHLKLTGAWGLYNQFLVRSSVVDEFGDYRYFWTISDGDQVPVQESRHFVVGLNYNKNDFTVSVEGYDKRTEGLTRYRQNQRFQDVYIGQSKSKGLDFFIKKEYKGHSAWVSYSLSETLEKFPYFILDKYRRALHDQRHEVKFATILNLKPFFFSMNYVYGSGFPDLRNLQAGGDLEKPYNRFDVALIYQLTTKKVLLEAGISILNVFNYENIKYANFIQIPDDQDVTVNYHAEAVPFTPAMFINFSF